ncbi:FmdE family protein [Methanobacterium ferruginis]|uniref:FmdE family protein n=1 Tax=Methanobacterium ferruginis TaxID=710191 RepID=UPI0025728D84|nr:FmdE family protein [Methanobacterium ferruginis]
MMKKQGVIIVLVALMAVVLCGAASAADSSINGGEGNISDINASEEVDPVLWVNVGYEYADDEINPEFTVTDSNNDSVAFDKTKYSDTLYKLNFTYNGVTNGTLFNVLVQAPGYVDQTQQVAVQQEGTDPEFVGGATFNMQATENYKLGREVTAKADQLLDFDSADDVLAITTAGVPQLNGGTTEDCIEGILNGSNGKISYGQGNLLMLRQTAVDPVDFAFIVKRGTALYAVCFRNGSAIPVYQGTISEDMQVAEWNNLIASVGGENAYSFASLANAWNAGAPADLLREAAFHGHVCQGTISGYTITQALLKYYPPIQETSGGPGSPGDITSYKVLGVPGDSDDDAVMYFLDATAGKSGYAGFDTSTTGANSSMVGFIRWNSQTSSGDLIVMRFKREENRQQFEQETGITLDNDLAELKFNTWILGKINTNPEQLVEFITEKTGLTEEQYYYLLGTASDIKDSNGTVRIPAQETHGLDMDYINSLNLPNATRTTSTSSDGQLTYDEIKQIGVDAANLAKQVFKDELGIDLEKDDSDLAILTSAGYIYLNGQTTEATWDGIFEVLGSRLSRSTLLPIHMGLWKPLWYAFVLRGADGTTLNALYMRYDQATQQWLVTNGSDGKKVNDIGPAALNNQTQLNNLETVLPDGNFFNIQSIANAWRNDPAFDQLVTFLFHDHACPGVQPGFFITDYIFENIPLEDNQSYTYIADSIYCKDDSLIYLLGISPGMGTYLNQRLPNDEVESELLNGGTEEGVLVVWDNELNVGYAYVISFKWATLDMSGLTTSAASREAMIAAYIDMYNGEANARVQALPVTTATDERIITESEFNALKQGGTASTTALEYLRGIPVRNLSDLIPVEGGSETGSSSQGTSTGSSTGISTANGSGASKFSTGSVGTTGTAVNAATQTTTTEDGSDSAGDSGSAYEVTKAGTQNTDDTPWGTYAIVGIVSVLVLGALGFFFRGNLFGQ